MLQAVVTFTEELAYKQAKEADELLAKGKYLGNLNLSPFLAKLNFLCKVSACQLAETNCGVFY